MNYSFTKEKLISASKEDLLHTIRQLQEENARLKAEKDEAQEALALAEASTAYIKAELQDVNFVFKEILESSMAGYWDWHMVEDYEYLSPTFKKMFGYEDDELINHPSSWQKLIFQEDIPVVFGKFQEHVASRGKVPFDSVARYRHKDGRTVWVYCRGRVVRWGKDGSPERIVGSHIDISVLKEVEAELKAYNVKVNELNDELARKAQLLEVSNAELERFVYSVAHDLRSPVRHISSFSQLLTRRAAHKLSELEKGLLDNIITSINRLGQLIDELLEYARMGNKELNYEEVSLDKIVKRCLHTLGYMMQGREIELKVENLPTIWADELMMEQVFLNLLSNAIKYTGREELAEIKVVGRETPTAYEIVVEDNGAGFDMSYQHKLFAIFQRLHDVDEFEGVGVGLANVQRIIQRHEGTIWAYGEEDKGARFHFTIPKKEV